MKDHGGSNALCMLLGPLDLAQSPDGPYGGEKIASAIEKKSERKENKTFEKEPFQRFFFCFKGFLALFAVISWGRGRPFV